MHNLWYTTEFIEVVNLRRKGRLKGGLFLPNFRNFADVYMRVADYTFGNANSCQNAGHVQRTHRPGRTPIIGVGPATGKNCLYGRL